MYHVCSIVLTHTQLPICSIHLIICTSYHIAGNFRGYYFSLFPQIDMLTRKFKKCQIFNSGTRLLLKYNVLYITYTYMSTFSWSSVLVGCMCTYDVCMTFALLTPNTCFTHPQLQLESLQQQAGTSALPDESAENVDVSNTLSEVATPTTTGASGGGERVNQEGLPTTATDNQQVNTVGYLLHLQGLLLVSACVYYS